ncbi:uncharacterized protein FA14DRAFT_92993 [Meira miltonrushii]|uniref:Uncharacterized protein n=1 Tax=Meira miltonrushii TaxID=1280837 RepID=A0A316V8I0_9BASI|nr:uncharacterized protein FA14DRAFT_92993 [Meira miltonrushii]PWN31785.1 hypothetical protein FA14DRAFT_92993 [Meira miltonrushii]
MYTVTKTIWSSCLFSLIFVGVFTHLVSVYAWDEVAEPNLQKRMMNEDQWHGLDSSTTYSAAGGSKDPVQDVPRKPVHGEDSKTKYRIDPTQWTDPEPRSGQKRLSRSPSLDGKQIVHSPSKRKSPEITEAPSAHTPSAPNGESHAEGGRKPGVIYLKPEHKTMVLSQELKDANAKFKKTYKSLNSKWRDKKLTLRQKIMKKATPEQTPRFSSIPGYHERLDKYPEAKVTLSPDFQKANRKFEKTYDKSNKGRKIKKSNAQARDRLNSIHENIIYGQGRGEGVLKKDVANGEQARLLRSSSGYSSGRSLPYTPRRGHEDEYSLLRSTSGVAGRHSHLASPSTRPHGKSAMEIDHSPDHDIKSGAKSRRTTFH